MGFAAILARPADPSLGFARRAALNLCAFGLGKFTAASQAAGNPMRLSGAKLSLMWQFYDIATEVILFDPRQS
ncbi:MAG: hypothetical protein ACPGNV_01600 [Mangrovicoccus sp.]